MKEGITMAICMVGGGTGGSSSTQKESLLKKIVKDISLNSQDSIKLEDALKEMEKECAFQQILNYLDSCGFQLEDVLIDPDLVGNAAFTSGNKLKFQYSSEISAENLIYELTHAYQYAYHEQNGNNYRPGGRETGPIEFEQRLLADLVAYRKDPDVKRSEWACRKYARSSYEIDETYEQWLESLLGANDTFPTSIDIGKFSEFDSLFRESHLFYSQYEYAVEYQLSIPDLFKTINEKCN